MTYRPELPPLPERIARLPVHRGYPVPWFVAKVDGEYDFRVMREGAPRNAFLFQRCWICGESLGAWVTFVLGPMCAVNRTSAEPPSHRECAEWSAIACPFLTRPYAKRREAGVPENAVEPDGIMLRRNPGVALCWHTTRAKFRQRAGFDLFDIGDPYEVSWYAEGREATRAEVMASIESGLPILEDLAREQGPPALRMLDKMTQRALKLVPA